MKKTTRINTEMRYINNRQQFTIPDLMAEFEISRSTAARDVAAIQELGMPLVSTVGPDGGFSVMRNQLLPAVQFNTDELKALFVSFMATTNQQLPFLQNRQTLTEKLLAIASQTQQDSLIALQQLLRFEQTNPRNTQLLELTDTGSPLLRQVITMSLQTRHLQLTLQNGVTDEIYLQYLGHQQASWRLFCYSLTKQQVKNLPLDQVKMIAPIATDLDLTSMETKIKQATPTPTITLKLGPHAIAQFNRYHQLADQLEYLDPFEQSAQYETYLDLNDQLAVANFIDWFLFLGTDVQVLKLPSRLNNQIQQRLRDGLN